MFLLTHPFLAERRARPRRRARFIPFLGRFAALGVVTVMFVGCIQAEIAVRVDDDGSGAASVLFAFDQSMLDLLESLDEGEGSGSSEPAEPFDPTSIFDGIDETIVPDAEVEPYEQGDFIGARITAPFSRVEDVPAMLDEITSGLAFPGAEPSTNDESGSAFERFVIERDGEGWRLDAVVAAPTTEEEATSADPADDEFGAALLESASFTIKVVLPGELEEHNADEAVERQLTWNLDLDSTQPRTLSARTSGESDELPWVLLSGGAVGLAAMGGIAWDVNRRRRLKLAP
jgi:hypothetical protein